MRIPGGGIRWWLTKRCVESGERVEAGNRICELEMTTGVYSSDAEAEAEPEAEISGIIRWTDVPEGSVMEQGQVIGWIGPD